MTAHLFVYGSLMRAAKGFGEAQRTMLASQSVSRGPARTRGRLYDLGDYPGLAPAGSESCFVKGELLELTDPVTTFAWLDLYESIDPANPDASEYDRVIQEVTLDNQHTVEAWLYIYNARRELTSPSALLIESGSWLHRDKLSG